MLERTKLRGPSTKVVTLLVSVSDKAFLVHRWLCPGFKLFRKEIGYERDYRLPLATEDRKGCMQRRAEYSDAAGYSLSADASAQRAGPA